MLIHIIIIKNLTAAIKLCQIRWLRWQLKLTTTITTTFMIFPSTHSFKWALYTVTLSALHTKKFLLVLLKLANMTHHQHYFLM